MSTVLSLIYLGLLCSLISIPSSSAAKAKGNVENKEKVSRKLVDPFISATENEKQSLALDSTLTVPTKSAEQWIRDYLMAYLERGDDKSDAGTGRQLPTESSLGDIIAVLGLGLLFINQLAVALGISSFLPILLIPVLLLALLVQFKGKAQGGATMGMEGLGWSQYQQ